MPILLGLSVIFRNYLSQKNLPQRRKGRKDKPFTLGFFSASLRLCVSAVNIGFRQVGSYNPDTLFSSA